MDKSRFEVYLDETGNLCVARIAHAGRPAFLVLDIAMAELKSDTFEVASEKLGGTILRLLSLSRQDILDGWGTPSNQELQTNDDYEIAQRLIGKSLSDRTAAHVSSIDFLLSREASRSEVAQQFFEGPWEALREKLLSFEPSK